MIGFLRTRNYRTLRLTPDRLSRARSEVGPDHVVLISQLFRRTEGTWGVIFADFYYHNFGVYSLSALSLLNKPILSAYLVFHPRWRVHHTKRPLSKPSGKHHLKLEALRKHYQFTQMRKWT